MLKLTHQVGREKYFTPMLITTTLNIYNGPKLVTELFGMAKGGVVVTTGPTMGSWWCGYGFIVVTDGFEDLDLTLMVVGSWCDNNEPWSGVLFFLCVFVLTTVVEISKKTKKVKEVGLEIFDIFFPNEWTI